jgi:hypothetical protein
MEYVSGRVDTQDTFVSTFGRYEVSAKVPVGQGMKEKRKREATPWEIGVRVEREGDKRKITEFVS